jgi:site-specific recombinase XerD
MGATLTTASIAAFQQWLSDRGRSEQTVKAYGADLRGFFEFAGDHDQDEFLEKAAQYLTHIRKHRAAKSVRRYLGTLRVYGKWLGFSDPLGDYLAPTPARPVPHPIPEGMDGVLAMLEEAEQQEHLNLVALCGLAGLRVGEAVVARVTDIDTLARTMKVRGKGDKERIVPVSDRLLAILEPTLQMHDLDDPRLVPLHERTARKVITRLAERASLARSVSSHDLRATFATAAYERSGDLRAVQELLGHSDSRTTEVYTGISMAAMRAAGDVA